MNTKKDRMIKTANNTKNPIPRAKLTGDRNPPLFLSEDIVETLRKMDNNEIVYSFRFFDRSLDLFNLGDVESNWFIDFMDTLKSTCQITRNEFKNQRQHYDCHDIPWDRLDVKFDLPWIEQLECVQYRISTSNGRVHGFMIGNHFYVVWLDPWHNLDRDDRFGPRKICTQPLTGYDVLNNKYLDLEQQLKAQQEANNYLMETLIEYEQQLGIEKDH